MTDFYFGNQASRPLSAMMLLQRSSFAESLTGIKRSLEIIWEQMMSNASDWMVIYRSAFHDGFKPFGFEAERQ